MPETLYKIRPLNLRPIESTQFEGYYCNYEIVDYQIIVTRLLDDPNKTFNVLIRYKDSTEIPYVCNDFEAAVDHCNKHWHDFMKLNFVDEAN